MNEIKNKEWFLERACINLLKVSNFHRLLYSLETKQISDEEYEREIEANESKYTIYCDEQEEIDIHSNEYQILKSIVKNIFDGEQEDLDDIELIFGLKIKL